MNSDDETLEMHLLQDQTADEYTPLLHLLQNRHLATFKSLVRRALNKQPPAIDINHRIGHPVLKTFLEIASSENLPDFARFLLEVGAEPNLINPEHSRAAIHFAAEEGRADVLAVLLADSRIQPNLEVSGGLTALHFAVKASCEECARLLLEYGANPNVPNSRGITALHMAADKGNKGMVRLILDTSQIIDADTYRDRKKETARMVIERKFPDIVLPAESTGQADPATLLRYHLNANDEANFLKTLESSSLIDAPHQIELLRLAVQRDLRRATYELLKIASPLDSTNLVELGRIAVERAHPEVLKELVAKSPRLMADRLLISASQELGIPARPGPGNRNERLQCLRIILAHDNVDVRQEDDKGNTPLHYAARAESREAVELLLRRGSYIGHPNKFGVPPLAHLAPGILEGHLNDCVTSSHERTEEYEIVLDYENLEPHRNGTEKRCDPDDEYDQSSPPREKGAVDSQCGETEALLYVANDRNLRHLLKHPILSSFLYLKYLKIRHILYVNFVLYLVFWLLLNGYIYAIVVNDEEASSNGTTSRSAGRESDDTKGTNLPEVWLHQPVLWVLLALSLVYLLIREICQLISSPLHYIASLDNWLELTLIGLTISLLCGAGREVGAVATLLSTWEFVILMAQHPRMSRDIEMFKTVTVNFVKFLVLYIFLILAFAFSFYVLFRGDENFPNAFGSLFKTIVMLTGEFEAGELPFVSYPVLSRLIFVGFVFLIVIILLNLLNGLAVNDTAEILAEAELVCLVARARLVAYAERVALGSPRFLPRTGLLGCLCPIQLPLMRRNGLTSAPLRFIKRRLMLFPRYLPHGKLSVKPLKNHEITLHGKSRSGTTCNSTLTMDPVIARRAKAILEARGKETSEEKMLARMDVLGKRMEGLETILREIRAALRNNNENTADDGDNNLEAVVDNA